MSAEILSIEAREPPIRRYLDLICHNQVARSIGSDDIQPLLWWRASSLNTCLATPSFRGRMARKKGPTSLAG